MLDVFSELIVGAVVSLSVIGVKVKSFVKPYIFVPCPVTLSLNAKLLFAVNSNVKSGVPVVGKLLPPSVIFNIFASLPSMDTAVIAPSTTPPFFKEKSAGVTFCNGRVNVIAKLELDCVISVGPHGFGLLRIVSVIPGRDSPALFL